MPRSLIDPDLRVKTLEPEFISSEECDRPFNRRRCEWIDCINEPIYQTPEGLWFCLEHLPEEGIEG